MESLDKPKRTLMPMRSDERLAQKIATKVLSRYPVTSILDIGCGDGIVSSNIDPSINYLGLDINEACIYEKKHDNPLIRYIRSSEIPEIMKKGGAWDMVLLFDVLEHTRDFTGLFELALQCAREYVIVSLPNELFFLDRLRMLFGKEHNAHSLDLVAQPEGFKHQFIVNIDKAKNILQKLALKYSYSMEEEVLRPLITKKKWQQPLSFAMRHATNESTWSQGSIMVFSSSNKKSPHADISQEFHKIT